MNELDNFAETWRLLGAIETKKGFGCFGREDSIIARALYEAAEEHHRRIRRMLDEAANVRV